MQCQNCVLFPFLFVCLLALFPLFVILRTGNVDLHDVEIAAVSQNNYTVTADR